MSRSARERRVFFIEEPVISDQPAHMGMEKDASGVIVVKPHLPPGLNEDEYHAAIRELVDRFFAEEIHEHILWYYTPMALNFSRHLQPALTVYDCMDELSLFKGAPAKLQELEQELISRADLIFTGGQTLYEGKRNDQDNVYLFSSSIDARHFEQARKNQADPADQAGIPHPRLGFFGVIDERMDLGLLNQLAQARPEWHLVMLGPVVKIEPESLPMLPNIHYLGMKMYEQLPHYLANWDVALLPFALNDSTRFISPTKIPEYLAGGKPVVSSPIRDVINPYGKQNYVSIASSADEFVNAIENILNMKKEETEYAEQKGVHVFMEKSFAPERIGLYGGSMGGATALYAFSHEPRVAALFRHSTFASLLAAFADILASNGLPGFLGYPTAAMGRLMSGEDLLKHRPAEVIKEAGDRPIYIVHGRSDRRISIRQSQELANAARSAGVNVTTWFPENGLHLQTPAVYPEEFEQRMVGFFRETLGG